MVDLKVCHYPSNQNEYLNCSWRIVHKASQQAFIYGFYIDMIERIQSTVLIFQMSMMNLLFMY